MRIAIPAIPYSDSFADNVAFTLRKMGHEVVMRRPVGHRTLRVLSSIDRVGVRLQRGYLTAADRWLLRCIRDNAVDVILAVTQVVNEEVLAEARRRGVRKRIAWWGDAPANLTRWGLLTREWDLVALKDPDGVAKFKRVGMNAILLHEAMNPAWHRPVAVQANDAIAVVGNFYAYRQVMVRLLQDRGVQVALYGSPLPFWALPELKRAHTGRYVVGEEKSRVFGEALACLNSTSLAEGNSLNCRAFEIAGAGGLQLIEAKPIISECFEPQTELLVYDTLEELFATIDRARRAPQEMDRVRRAGARRALAHHTYAHRLEILLATA